MNICNHEINVTAQEPTIFLSLDINANNYFCQSPDPCPGPSLTFSEMFMEIFRLYFKGHSNKWSLTSTSIIRYSLVELNLKAWSF